MSVKPRRRQERGGPREVFKMGPRMVHRPRAVVRRRREGETTSRNAGFKNSKPYAVENIVLFSAIKTELTRDETSVKLPRSARTTGKQELGIEHALQARADGTRAASASRS